MRSSPFTHCDRSSPRGWTPHLISTASLWRGSPTSLKCPRSHPRSSAASLPALPTYTRSLIWLDASTCSRERLRCRRHTAEIQELRVRALSAQDSSRRSLRSWRRAAETHCHARPTRARRSFPATASASVVRPAIPRPGAARQLVRSQRDPSPAGGLCQVSLHAHAAGTSPPKRHRPPEYLPVAGEFSDIPVQPLLAFPRGGSGQCGRGIPVEEDHDRPDPCEDLGEVGGARVLMLEAGRDYDPGTETPMFNYAAGRASAGGLDVGQAAGFLRRHRRWRLTDRRCAL